MAKSLPMVLEKHLGSAVDAATSPVLQRIQQSFDSRLAEMDRRFQNFSERLTEQGDSVVALSARLSHLESQLDLARSRPRPPVERSANWDREVDRAIFTINCKEEVPFGAVQAAIGPWLQGAGYTIGDQCDLEGSGISRRF
eukprot:5986254-Pyramimonas_sp.AAC.1